MPNKRRESKCINLKLCYFVILSSFALIGISCSKQEVLEQNISTVDSAALQINYITKIKNNLQDSLSANDFMTIDFSKVYKSKDVRSKNYFVRLTFKGKKISSDFILLQTDSAGNILKGRIVKVTFDTSIDAKANIAVASTTLNGKETRYLKNAQKNRITSNNSKQDRVLANSNESSMLAAEEPVGEQTLPDVVVTGYIYDNPAPFYWYCFNEIIDTNGGGTYTYGAYETSAGGGSSPNGVYADEVAQISYEDATQPSIDITKYVKCFSLLSNVGATFKITIYSDIPVNDDPNKLFDFSTGACGHSFLQFSKSNGANIIQQDIGFYPESGWKSVANSSVTSKLVDNSGHEYNASLTITVNATQFQNALNKMQGESHMRYDIDDFNCTDFALSVFNAAASQHLYIPRRHIPNGTFGTESNTPQGLYIELENLQKNGGYPGGQISIPKNAPAAGKGHGACN